MLWISSAKCCGQKKKKSKRSKLPLRCWGTLLVLNLPTQMWLRWAVVGRCGYHSWLSQAGTVTGGYFIYPNPFLVICRGLRLTIWTNLCCNLIFKSLLWFVCRWDGACLHLLKLLNLFPKRPHWLFQQVLFLFFFNLEIHDGTSEKVALFQFDLFIIQEPSFLDYVYNKDFLAFFCLSNLPNPLWNI